MTRPNIPALIEALAAGQFRKATREDFADFAGCTSAARFYEIEHWTIIWDRDEEGDSGAFYFGAYSAIEDEQLMWRPGIDADWQRT